MKLLKSRKPLTFILPVFALAATVVTALIVNQVTLQGNVSNPGGSGGLLELFGNVALTIPGDPFSNNFYKTITNPGNPAGFAYSWTANESQILGRNGCVFQPYKDLVIKITTNGVEYTITDVPTLIPMEVGENTFLFTFTSPTNSCGFDGQYKLTAI